jgi:lipase chaperone LimK
VNDEKYTMNSAMQKYVIYGLLMLVGVIIITLIMFPNSEIMPIKDTVVTNTTKIIPEDNSANPNTIASAWQWEKVSDNENMVAKTEAPTSSQAKQSDATATFPFTDESVYKALHDVKLDDNGDIILDDDALIALNNALDHSEVKLDAEALQALQDLIRKGLPGNAGEQTAQIVADFYQYLGAKNEFNSLYETNRNADETIESYETEYNELLALRQLYLSTEVADQLFAVSNANSRYMFDSMKLEADASLSGEEKKQEQDKIVQRHVESSTNVNNWNERYQAFLDDKQYIINSSVSDDEKRDQLTGLMHQHFSHEELEYVSHLQLDSL